MGINFFTSAETPSIVDLDKAGDILDLEKVTPGLKKVIAAASWEPAVCGPSADLDLCAIMVTKADRIRVERREKVIKKNGEAWMAPVDVIFFNHMKTKGICLDEDDQDGKRKGDNETIHVDLEQIDPEIEKIYFCIVIHEAEEKGQTFKMINSPCVKLRDEETKDANGNYKELARVSLKENFGNATYVIAASLEKNRNSWSYKKIGDSGVGTLNNILAKFV